MPNWSDLPRPGSLGELEERGGRPETFRRLSEARVIEADYAALLRDYPDLPASRDGVPDRDAVDRWLLDNFAVMSLSQAAQADVNTPIPCHPGGTASGIRFSGHGRAASIAGCRPSGDAKSAVIFNVKGVGREEGETPTLNPQSNGLLPAHCALYEFTLHTLVETALRRAGSSHRVLPAYAVIDCGFDEFASIPGGRYPAGLLVRQGHFRPMAGDLQPTGAFTQREAARIELLLRQFGLTSGFTSPWLHIDETGQVVRADRTTAQTPEGSVALLKDVLAMSGSDALDVVNVQFTDHVDWAERGLELVDLHYGVRRRFENALASTVNDREFGLGGIIRVSDLHAVQPKPGLSGWIEAWLGDTLEATVRERWGLAGDAVPTGGFARCMRRVDRVRGGGRFGEAVSASVVREFVRALDAA